MGPQTLIFHIYVLKLPTPDGTWTRANYFRTYSEAELACGERGRESLGISCSLLVYMLFCVRPIGRCSGGHVGNGAE